MPLRSLKVGHAHALREMWQLDQLETQVAEQINDGGYDLVFVHPCAVRYTPSILRKLRGPVVYFMQEARRPSYEARVRHRRRETWRARGAGVGRLLDMSSGAVAEPFIVRSDRTAAQTPGIYVLCNSLFSGERILASYGIDAHVSYLGVDPDRFAPAPHPSTAAGPPGAGPGRVVAVGRFNPSKRHDLVIEALAEIPEPDRPHLTIVGEGPVSRTDDALRDLGADLGVELEIARAASDEDLITHYRSATATICASELEPFGLTALESIACGTPVVAVRQGGFRETIEDGRTGVLVDPTARALADGVRRILAGPDSFPSERLHGSIASGHWTWDDAVARLHAHFERARDEWGR